MVPGEDKAEVSLSSEFFKKLNQQIVQKDNLIKLLQLQIKNLKGQLDETAVDSQKNEEVSKALEKKEEEISGLQNDLEEQKTQLIRLTEEKDEQINALNKVIEEHQSLAAGAEVVDASELAELQSRVDRLTEDIKNERDAKEALEASFAQEKSELQNEIESIKEQISQKPEAGPNLELEEQLASLRQENDLFLNEIKNLKEQLSNNASAEDIVSLKSQADEAQELQGKVTKLEEELAAALSRLSQAGPGSQYSESELSELENDIENLRALLEEKDAQIERLQSGGGAVLSPAQAKILEETGREVEKLKFKLSEKEKQVAIIPGLQEKAARVAELEEAVAQIPILEEKLQKASEIKDEAGKIFELERTISELSEKANEAGFLRAKLTKFENETIQFTEAAMKLTAMESEREKLSLELETQERAFRKIEEELDDTKKVIIDQKVRLEEQAKEVAELNNTIEELRSSKAETDESRGEIEQLTNQVADHLLAIQRFEDMLRQNQDRLLEKDREIISLRERIGKTEVAPQPIHISSESEVISSFIDFFDGLDAILTRNPNPELQSLHKKLLERLIIPNQISYIPVISEKFDPAKHLATDYFRSDRFPDKCIVFEVEKGYAQGDLVVKKAKVWVVQNLFDCNSCGSTQSNSESRFCHLCGSKIVAPNELPVDSLPYFEPTSTTYLRFAERMIEKSELPKAKEYLLEGLNLDSNSVPVLIKLSDVHAMISEFDEGMECLQKAAQIKPDERITERIKFLEVRNSIFQQARNLNLPPEEFEKLVSLIQKK